VQDPAVTVAFPWVGHEGGASFVAWTTTPWTLCSNLALCVHPEFVYVLVSAECVVTF
jgi:isoleucyl-tRNA synthetase